MLLQSAKLQVPLLWLCERSMSSELYEMGKDLPIAKSKVKGVIESIQKLLNHVSIHISEGFLKMLALRFLQHIASYTDKCLLTACPSSLRSFCPGPKWNADHIHSLTFWASRTTTPVSKQAAAQSALSLSLVKYNFHISSKNHKSVLVITYRLWPKSCGLVSPSHLQTTLGRQKVPTVTFYIGRWVRLLKTNTQMWDSSRWFPVIYSSPSRRRFMYNLKQNGDALTYSCASL